MLGNLSNFWLPFIIKSCMVIYVAHFVQDIEGRIRDHLEGIYVKDVHEIIQTSQISAWFDTHDILSCFM